MNQFQEKYIRKLIRESIEKLFLLESFEDEMLNMPYEIFRKIKSKQKIEFSVIPKTQYHNALKEFMKFGKFRCIKLFKTSKYKDTN